MTSSNDDVTYSHTLAKALSAAFISQSSGVSTGSGLVETTHHDLEASQCCLFGGEVASSSGGSLHP